jgi:response regulator RpfG family c-di-GMP phosphodiesterase
VAEFSHLLAVNMGLETGLVDKLRLASPMHDIGKIGISDEILNKPGKLTDAEYDLIKSHTVIGWQILKNSSREILKIASIVALQHHERWDGRGYPGGLAGENINILGRITSVADNFDALTHCRVYKEAWHLDRVIELFISEKGRQFDPHIIDIFMDIIDEFAGINKKYSE